MWDLSDEWQFASGIRDFAVLLLGIPFYLGCKYIPNENGVQNLSMQTVDTNLPTQSKKARGKNDSLAWGRLELLNCNV